MSDSCPGCGTHTGTHWPDCYNYLGPKPKTLDTPVTQRTNGEKNSFIQGYEQAINNVETHGLERTKEILKLVKEVI